LEIHDWKSESLECCPFVLFHFHLLFILSHSSVFAKLCFFLCIKNFDQERLRDTSIRLQSEEKTTVKTHEQLIKMQAHARVLEEKLRASELKFMGAQQQLQHQQSQLHGEGAGNVTRLQAEIEVCILVSIFLLFNLICSV
jgi:hypothetical protein